MQRELLEPGAIYGRKFRGGMMIFPPERLETNFASLPTEMGGKKVRALEDFTDDEAAVFRTDAFEQTLTSVFFERFFNRRSIQDIAERLNTTPETVESSFTVACGRVERIAEVLDKKKAAEKYLIPSRRKYNFSHDETAFLLNRVFGFTAEEIVDILGKYARTATQRRIQQMAKKYRAAFDSVDAAV
jgi:hypothetical protein